MCSYTGFLFYANVYTEPQLYVIQHNNILYTKWLSRFFRLKSIASFGRATTMRHISHYNNETNGWL